MPPHPTNATAGCSFAPSGREAGVAEDSSKNQRGRVEAAAIVAEVRRNERRGRRNGGRDVGFIRAACYETGARMTSLQIPK